MRARYLKAHYPAAFYTALLNNQPMGFYHPATLVKDAQRRGVRFHSIDVQMSDWTCAIEPDGGIRLGLLHVHGLRTSPARPSRTRAQGGAVQIAGRSGHADRRAAGRTQNAGRDRGARELWGRSTDGIMAGRSGQGAQ